MGKNEVMPQSSVARPRQGICATVSGTFMFPHDSFVGAIHMTDLSRVPPRTTIQSTLA